MSNSFGNDIDENMHVSKLHDWQSFCLCETKGTASQQQAQQWIQE
jgi:hypothetical protein